jgi:hypothetical protein
MKREYPVQTALRDTQVPVPRTVAFCDEESVIGAPLYVMEMLDGIVFRTAADVAHLDEPSLSWRPTSSWTCWPGCTPSTTRLWGWAGSASLRGSSSGAAFAATNGAGATTQLVADLGALSGALTTTQQAASHAVGNLSSSSVGYSQLSAFTAALQAAVAASTSAQSACRSTASNACLSQIQALNSNIKAANNLGVQLNTVSASG